MKKLSSKSLTIVLALSMVTTIFVLQSCRSLDPIPCTLHRDSVAYTIHHTVDTVFLRDSVFISEKIRGDTVYLTRTEYRDRWRTRVVHDTMRHTEYVDRVIEKPPEQYVPKFHKWCTILLFALLTLMAARWGLKRWL